MFVRCCSGLLAGLLAGTACAASQPAMGVVPRPGQTVSVRVPSGERVTGQLVELGSDSMVIQAPAGRLSLGTTLLDGAKVKTGSKSGATRAGALGAVIGLVAGTVVGIASTSTECGADCIVPTAITIPLFSGGGLLAGGFIGARIGASREVEVWSPAVSPGQGTGQFNADLVTGDVVRLWHAGKAELGTVAGGAGESVMIRRASGSDTLVELGALERYGGEGHRTRKEMWYGAVVGAAMGAAAHFFSVYSVKPPLTETIGDILRPSLVGAGVGFLLGGRSHPVWTAVGKQPVSGFAALPVIGPRRIGFTARLAW